MKFSELPIETQNYLTQQKVEYVKRKRNTAYEILVYSNDGNRYFYARRSCIPWWDDKGHAMPFGGGTVWAIKYGAVQISRRRMLGCDVYNWVDGRTFSSRTMEDGSVVEIPSELKTKKEVVNLIKQLKIFNI